MEELRDGLARLVAEFAQLDHVTFRDAAGWPSVAFDAQCWIRRIWRWRRRWGERAS
jgi:hypothetical protein